MTQRSRGQCKGLDRWFIAGASIAAAFYVPTSLSRSRNCKAE
jgi:hypothetical protein